MSEPLRQWEFREWCEAHGVLLHPLQEATEHEKTAALQWRAVMAEE